MQLFCPTAVSGRASAMSNTPTHSIAASISQPQTPTPSPIISPSAMLPIYPAIDIDAQVSPHPGATALTALYHCETFISDLNRPRLQCLRAKT